METEGCVARRAKRGLSRSEGLVELATRVKYLDLEVGGGLKRGVSAIGPAAAAAARRRTRGIMIVLCVDRMGG